MHGQDLYELTPIDLVGDHDVGRLNETDPRHNRGQQRLAVVGLEGSLHFQRRDRARAAE